MTPNLRAAALLASCAILPIAAWPACAQPASPQPASPQPASPEPAPAHAAAPQPAAPQKTAASPALAAIAQTWFDQDVAMHPVSATATGIHTGDALLDDQSARAHATEIQHLHATLDALAKLDPASLPPSARDDRDILTAEINGQLLEEEHVQQWRHNPDIYVGLATNAAYTLIERDFAPLPDRLRETIAREHQIPALLATARLNLTAIPAPYADIAIEDAAGAIDFLGTDVPHAFASLTDAKQQADLASATNAAVGAMRDYLAWLRVQKKSAHGDFAYGPDNFRRLLDADMITLTPDEVLAAGQAQLKRDQDAFAAASRAIDPKKPASALAVMEKDHPTGPNLVPTAKDQLAGLRQFIVAHHIIDLPGQDLPVVAETPEFQRAEVFGELDPPGPFETHAITAYYYITPPDPHDSPAKQDAYLGYFNRALLLNLGVHEALPGHFTQYLYMRANPGWSLIRKTGHSYTATEGWAHYTEQLMVEQGLAANEAKLPLAQAQDALLRDCRLVASVQMHVHGMSLSDATKLMEKSCHQPHLVAYKEARRGTVDPGYFSYTLGKLMILKLREDARARDGAAFSLAKFHDAFQNAALVPIAIIRREIMGQDGKLL